MNKVNYRKSPLYLFLFIIIMIHGCGKNDKYSYKEKSTTSVLTDSSSRIKNINVFIENSGSMKAFLKLGGIADKTIHDLNTNLSKVYPNAIIVFNTIDNNGKIKINIQNFKRIPIKAVGNLTIIPDMLQDVVNISGNNTINIFISDFIYANGIRSQILDHYRNDVNQVFNNYKSDLLVYQLFSKIDTIYPGIFFNKSLRQFPNHYAPFYLFVFGNNDVLKTFDQSISLKFEVPDSITLRKKLFEKNSNSLNAINYKVAEGSSSSIGIIRTSQGVMNSLTEIIKMKKGRGSNKVQFSVLLSDVNLFVSDNFIENPENYLIKPAYFKLEQIKKYNDPNGVYSHELVLSSTNIRNDTLSIKLKEIFSKTDDSIINNPYTTFGLDYLIRGIKDSYNQKLTNEKSHFEIVIPIHLKPSNYFWIFFFLFLIPCGGFTYKILKSNKRKSR